MKNTTDTLATPIFLDEKPKSATRPLAGLPSTSIPLDINVALSRFDNDRQFFDEMSKSFLQQLPKRVAEIKTALATADARTINRIAHNLKGMSATLSADKLASLNAILEEQSRNGNLDQTNELIIAIEKEADIVINYLSEIGVLT